MATKKTEELAAKVERLTPAQLLAAASLIADTQPAMAKSFAQRAVDLLTLMEIAKRGKT